MSPDWRIPPARRWHRRWRHVAFAERPGCDPSATAPPGCGCDDGRDGRRTDAARDGRSHGRSAANDGVTVPPPAWQIRRKPPNTGPRPQASDEQRKIEAFLTDPFCNPLSPPATKRRWAGIPGALKKFRCDESKTRCGGARPIRRSFRAVLVTERSALASLPSRALTFTDQRDCDRSCAADGARKSSDEEQQEKDGNALRGRQRQSETLFRGS